MTCPHGLRSQPETCSQCIGAVPQVVTIVDDRVLVDGEDRRPLDPTESSRSYYARRGGSAHHNGRKPRT